MSKAELTNPPCECGSTAAAWQGPLDGQREYMCPRCYLATRAYRLLTSPHIQNNAHRMGMLGVQDLHLAISYVRDLLPGV